MKTEQEVLALNNAYESYWYCMDNKDANIKLHEDVIVNTKNAEYACDFARNIAGVNVERLQEVVINYGHNFWYGHIYEFALNIKNSNKEELFKILLKLGSKFWINEFIRNIPLSEEIKTLIIFM